MPSGAERSRVESSGAEPCRPSVVPSVVPSAVPSAMPSTHFCFHSSTLVGLLPPFPSAIRFCHPLPFASAVRLPSACHPPARLLFRLLPTVLQQGQL